jgi:DNA-binding response OmpR family regulator
MPRKILLVDDDPEMLALLRETLDAFGTIFKASSGDDALRVFGEEQPSLVILDVTMPVMSGFEILQAVRLVDPGVAVVMVSAGADVAAAKRALDGGASAYMTKPFDSGYLCAEVRRLLDRGETRPAGGSAEQPWRILPS